MGDRVLLLIGTKKGLFLAASDGSRREWELCGPRISGTWTVYGASYDAPRGRIFAGACSNWYGPAVWWSDDAGETWAHSSAGLTYGDGGPAVEQVWCVTPAPDGTVLAGVDPAGLFRSRDGGRTWTHLAALRDAPWREGWRPTNAGLPLHDVLVSPRDAGRLWAAVGGGGVYVSADGGDSWERAGESAGPYVHGLALAPEAERGDDERGDEGSDADEGGERGGGGGEECGTGRVGERLYQQHVDGVFRSDDGGRTWRDVSDGLPSRFGFPVAVHPRDGDTLYVVPLERGEGRRGPPGGRLAVWRSRDAGGSWQRLDRGLPEESPHAGVWRAALATDALAPAGVYCGTTTGQLFYSPDEGETWGQVAPYLPPILSVTAVTLSG